MSIHIGDLVTRKKYNHDVTFKVKKIILDKTAILSGEDIRLEATADLEDLQLIDKDARSNSSLCDVDFQTTQDVNNLVIGKVLHVDGDARYLDKCMNMYKKHKVPAVGYRMDEDEIYTNITNLLVKHKPDILVITGHDAYRKYLGKDEFKNSEKFVKAVKNARVYQPDKDSLVIFAGACQSYYEGLIDAGANFASSPSRMSINVLDPVKIAIMVATSHVGSYLDINKILDCTINKNKGIGGIDTRGVARRIY